MVLNYDLTRTPGNTYSIVPTKESLNPIVDELASPAQEEG